METQNKQRTLKNKVINTALDMALIAAGALGYIGLIRQSKNAYHVASNVPTRVASAYQVKKEFDNISAKYSKPDYFSVRGIELREKNFNSILEKHRANLGDEKLQVEISDWERFVDKQKSRSRAYGLEALGVLVGLFSAGCYRLYKRFGKFI